METRDSKGTALIIGGCRGIGKAVSLRLAKDGFNIVATARAATPETTELAAKITAMSVEFTLLNFDVCDAVKIKEEYARAFPETAPDVLIYNAGIAKDNMFAFMQSSEWNDVINTNVNGFYNTVQPLVFGMLARRKGRIVVVSSVSGQTGQAGQVNYSASKAALIGAAKALAREVGRKGILVNVVAPGLIATEMIKDVPVERVLPLIPLNRVGKPEEVAGAVSFLCGEDSTYMQGQVLAVNGGLYM